MIGLLAPLGITAAKAIGAHLLPHIPGIKHIPGVQSLASLSGGTVSNIEGAVSGLGLRFVAGFVTAYYLSNEQFRQGADQCIEAVGKSIEGVL